MYVDCDDNLYKSVDSTPNTVVTSSSNDSNIIMKNECYHTRESNLLHDGYKNANTFDKMSFPKCHNIIYYI